MASIRSRDTGPEMRLRRALYKTGLRGWRCHVRTLPGKPDIAFTRAKVAIFCDGAFWHGHPDHFKPGQAGSYWDTKIARTVARDRQADSALSAAGWLVLRYWDFDIRERTSECVEEIVQAVMARRAAIVRAPK